MRYLANAHALAAAMILLFHSPFTGFRDQKPGTLHKITLCDLPQPYATKSSFNFPGMVARPENAWPSAPAGFKVELYAAGLDNLRTLRTAPNGDIFLAESGPGRGQ
jgi:glucose/arabinose dehydrogenase